MAVSLCSVCNVIMTDREARNGCCDSCRPAGMIDVPAPVAVAVPSPMELAEPAESRPPSQVLVVARTAVISLLTLVAAFFSTYQKDGKDLLGIQYAEISDEMKIGDQVIKGHSARRKKRIALLNQFLTEHTFVLAVIVAVFTGIGVGLNKSVQGPHEDPRKQMISYLAAFLVGAVLAIVLSNPLGGQFQFLVIGLVIFGGVTMAIDRLSDKPSDNDVRAIVARASR